MTAYCGHPAGAYRRAVVLAPCRQQWAEETAAFFPPRHQQRTRLSDIPALLRFMVTEKSITNSADERLLVR